MEKKEELARTQSPLAVAPAKPPDPGAGGNAQPPAPSKESVDTLIESSARNIHDSFGWLASNAQLGLDTLKENLAHQDEPPFIVRLAEAALDAALLAGGAAAGEFIAGKLLGDAAGPLSAVVKHEFVKALFEEGVDAGVEVGRAALSGHGPHDAAGRFIASQKQGVTSREQGNQISWNKTGRLKMRTLEEMKTLESACSEVNVKEAASKQYEASRDAWVAYLAQAKYGANEPAADRGDLQDIHKTTDMRNQEQRDRSNATAPGWVPSRAPAPGDAIVGKAPGVLVVLATLPGIDGTSMNGTPKVKLALLNGVNELIREDYAHRPLGTLAIPRQIVAKVDGEQPNFTLNVNEAGRAISITHAEASWLRARARIGHPEHTELAEDGGSQKEGMELLLNELVADEIQGQLGGAL